MTAWYVLVAVPVLPCNDTTVVYPACCAAVRAAAVQLPLPCHATKREVRDAAWGEVAEEAAVAMEEACASERLLVVMPAAPQSASLCAYTVKSASAGGSREVATADPARALRQ